MSRIAIHGRYAKKENAFVKETQREMENNAEVRNYYSVQYVQNSGSDKETKWWPNG